MVISPFKGTEVESKTWRNVGIIQHNALINKEFMTAFCFILSDGTRIAFNVVKD